MSRRVVYRTLNFGKGTIPANTPLFKISDTKPYTSGLVLLPDFNELTSSFNSFTSSYSTGSFTGSFTGNFIGTASFALNTISGSIQEQLDEKVNITDLGTLSRQEFTYTTGLQEFTIVQTPAAIYNVFVNGQELLSTQYSVATDVLTIIDTLVNGDTISVIYSTVPVNVPPSYTKVETDNLLSGKEDLTNKATDLTSPNNTEYPTTQAVVNELLKLDLKTQLLDRQTRYFLPRAGSTTFIDNLGVRSIVLSGNSSTNERYQALQFATSATAGTLAFQRGQVFSLPTEETSPFVKLTRRISPNSNVADSRFFTGITPNYGVTAPTNVEPDTLLNVIGVGKLSTSDNLHIIHNDASGTATTIDLGSNYPFNNVVFYWYTFEFTKEMGTTNIVVRVTRTDATGNSIFVEHTLTSDLTTLVNPKSPFAWISNNATAEVASYLDYGCIAENYPVKF